MNSKNSPKVLAWDYKVGKFKFLIELKANIDMFPTLMKTVTLAFPSLVSYCVYYCLIKGVILFAHERRGYYYY